MPYSYETRASVLSLIKLDHLTPLQVANIFNIPKRSVCLIIQHAIERGCNPAVSPYIKAHHIADAPCLGRPK
jgi:hypothetical protein